MGTKNSKSSFVLLKQFSKSNPKQIKKEFKRLFKKYDVDNSGEIDKAEGKQMINDFLRSHSFPDHSNLADYAVKVIWGYADTDCDGVLSEKEFFGYLLKYHELVMQVQMSVLVYGNDIEELYEPLPNAELFEALLMCDNEKVIYDAFFDTMEENDLDDAIRYFMYLSDINGVAFEFLIHGIDEEIGKGSVDVFSKSCRIRKMFRVYAELKGIPYLQKAYRITQKMTEYCSFQDFKIDYSVLHTLIHQLGNDALDSDEEFPTGFKDESSLISLMAQIILREMLFYVKDIPPSFKAIFAHIKHSMYLSEHFKGTEKIHQSIGSLCFSEFALRPLMDLKQWGFTYATLPTQTSNQFLMISNIIQHISDLSLPVPEENMEKYVPLIDESIPKVQQFYGTVSEEFEDVLQENPNHDTPKHLRTNCLGFLHSIFSKNYEKIVHYIKQQEYPDQYLPRVETAMSK